MPKETFAGGCKITKFMKFFSLESFPAILYNYVKCLESCYEDDKTRYKMTNIQN